MKSLGECIYMAVISVYDDVGGVREWGGERGVKKPYAIKKKVFSQFSTIFDPIKIVGLLFRADIFLFNQLGFLCLSVKISLGSHSTN